MASVTLSDGTVVNNVPEGVTPQQVLDRLITKRQTDPSFFKVAGREGTASIIDNLMGMVDVPANLFARATDLGGRKRQQMTGQPQNLINPPPLSQNFVMPSSNDIFAGAQVGAENLAQAVTGSNVPPTTFQDAQAKQQQITDIGQREQPLASAIGDVTGDAMALMSLRGSIPGRSGQSIATERGLAQLNAARASTAAKSAAKQNFSAMANAPDMRRAMGALFENSSGLKSLINKSGRAAEAGLEGATVALLNGGDPLETAAYSAGGQAAGSLLLSGATGLFSGSIGGVGMKVATASLAIGSLLQLVKEGVAGGNNNILDSMSGGFSKVLLGAALGALSGVAGAGRVTQRFPVRSIPAIADGITSLQRGATISVLNELLKDPAAETVVNKLASSPDFFGAQAGRRIRRAMTTESISLSETIESLSDGNKEFRDAFNSLRNN